MSGSSESNRRHQVRSGFLPIAEEIGERQLARLLAEAADFSPEVQAVVGALLAENPRVLSTLEQLDALRTAFALDCEPAAFQYALMLESERTAGVPS